jgi:hypothetical protein
MRIRKRIIVWVIVIVAVTFVGVTAVGAFYWKTSAQSGFVPSTNSSEEVLWRADIVER